MYSNIPSYFLLSRLFIFTSQMAFGLIFTRDNRTPVFRKKNIKKCIFPFSPVFVKKTPPFSYFLLSGNKEGKYSNKKRGGGKGMKWRKKINVHLSFTFIFIYSHTNGAFKKIKNGWMGGYIYVLLFIF
ncbi:unnamed protein product [Meloidogyne enterolobii]|uniref:Uncharacterized protein n=1 Tax=Meloidogyne enterolobii TaxID=390850 RepID=A0ACB1ANC4_MELEN